jgi:hypothetical protein
LNVADYALTDWQTENRYEIYEEWRWRYGPDVRFNTEHVFGLRLPGIVPIRIAAREHLNFMWLPWQHAASIVFFKQQCRSHSQIAGAFATRIKIRKFAPPLPANRSKYFFMIALVLRLSTWRNTIRLDDAMHCQCQQQTFKNTAVW